MSSAHSSDSAAPREGRLLGLDVGDVRIGVAVSDPLGIIAQPHQVVQRTTLDRDLAALLDIAADREAVGIVVGMPLNQHGQPGLQAGKVQAFIDALRALTPLPILTIDERFTTALAQRALIAADVSRKGRRKVVDKIAAQQILQTYLDRRARERVDRRP